MSPCPNPEPPYSAHSAFLHAAHTFATLSPHDDIPAAFANVRQLLSEVLIHALDPNAYALSFSTLASFGLSDLMEYEATGNVDALEKLKQKVQASIEFLP
jgi:hypothetical protein